MKNYNLSLIREKHSYSVKDICELLGVCKKTVSNWHTKGLKAIDENKNNMLFYGGEVYNFLFESSRKRRIKLNKDEFYCFVCHKAVNGVPKSRLITLKDKKLGPDAKQVIISAICENCGHKISKLSSDRITPIEGNEEEISVTYEEIEDEQLMLLIFP